MIRWTGEEVCRAAAIITGCRDIYMHAIDHFEDGNCVGVTVVVKSPKLGRRHYFRIPEGGDLCRGMAEFIHMHWDAFPDPRLV